MFDAATYVERRKVLKDKVKSGIALFLGNDESPMNYPDNVYSFRQDSSFLYYFGLSEPGLCAVVDFDEGREIIFGDNLTTDEIVWMGTGPTLEEMSSKVGVLQTMPSSKLGPYLESVEASNRQIRFLPQYRDTNKIKLFEYLAITPKLVNKTACETLIAAIVAQRAIKSDEELVEIGKAVDITADMHIAAMTMARAGMKESEIAGAIEGIALAGGGGISFPVILTVNGQTLHNHYHGNTLKEGQLVLNDSGAQTEMMYAGDMSRTFPVDSKFTTRQSEIYNVALDSHEAAIAALAPGVPFADIHRQACLTITEGLKGLGLMKGDALEAVEAGAHTLFFPCGLGHMMGLDVHDMENLGEDYVGYGEGFTRNPQFGYKSLRLARPLQPGFVVTIEPGIYFIPELIDVWKNEGRFSQFINYDKVETYKDFGGLRSEEDFVITDSGYRLLGKPVPKTIADIEALRG